MKTGAYNGLKLHYLTLLSTLLIFNSCQTDYQPKPVGHFRIGLPQKTYTNLQVDCPFTFQINQNATYKDKQNCWGDVLYPSIRANVQLTYKHITDKEQLFKVLKESQDLAYEHATKADGIAERLYTNPERNIYGMMYKMKGNAATSNQFFVTDSNSHFLRGVLYFYSVPNADSLKPVNDFMESEMVHMIETLQWKSSLP